jgi:hypothetical protein
MNVMDGFKVAAGVALFRFVLGVTIVGVVLGALYIFGG